MVIRVMKYDPFTPDSGRTELILWIGIQLGEGQDLYNYSSASDKAAILSIPKGEIPPLIPEVLKGYIFNGEVDTKEKALRDIDQNLYIKEAVMKL